jgi:regulator of protease activity HflC (stomatin/prohibitin superfamily)
LGKANKNLSNQIIIFKRIDFNFLGITILGRRINMETKKLIKSAVIAAAVIAIILILNPASCVGATDRGIRYAFSKPSKEVLTPGIHLHIPLIGSIKTWSIVPNKLAIDIPIDSAGAISKDNQIIGVRLVVYWQYDEDEIYTIAARYSEKSIENLLASEANSAIKTIIGTYTIFDLAANQSVIGDNVFQLIRDHVKDRPVEITQLNISNFDWSPDFDKQINATMEAAQRLRQAEQQANIAEQENRRLAIEAEARAKAQVAKAEGDLKEAELNAQARIVRANAERDAKIAEGEGVRQYNQLIAQNLQTEIRIRELAIEQERAKRWNGVEVPTYLPLNPAGGVVTLPAK